MVKTIIVIFLLFPLSLSGQIKWDNQDVINYFTRNDSSNLKGIESIDGKTWIAIPIEHDIKKNEKFLIIEDYPVKYEIKNDDVEVVKVKCKVMIFDFEKDKISTANLNVDDDVWGRPKELKKKIKKRLKL